MSVIQTNAQARAWLLDTLGVSRETLVRLARFHDFLLAEAALQNLIAPSTFEHIWARHIVDSAQLLTFAPPPNGIWLDLGSGAGFPGLAIAILSDWQISLVESRARRIDYLERAAGYLSLTNVTIIGKRLEVVPAFPAAVISARAFAPLDRLLDTAHRFSTENTRWLLPKGKNAVNELETIAGTWHHLFHVEQSITDADAKIIVGAVKSRINAP